MLLLHAFEPLLGFAHRPTAIAAMLAMFVERKPANAEGTRDWP